MLSSVQYSQGSGSCSEPVDSISIEVIPFSRFIKMLEGLILFKEREKFLFRISKICASEIFDLC